MYGRNFVERVNTLLINQGKSREIIAKDLNISYQSFADWKRRDSLPSADICIKIARYLGVSVEYLIFGEEYGEDEDIEQIISLLKTLSKEKRSPIVAIVKSQVEFWKNTK